MRILMTGHLGYIGTVAVPVFQEHGHEVVGLDTDLFSGCTFGPSVGPAASIPNLALDIRDVEPDHLAGFDAVVHFAGLSNHPLGDMDPALTDAINHRATIRLAQAAKRAGVTRFAFSSSCANYGAAGDDFIDEAGAFAPMKPYGQSKVDAELGLARLADDRFSPVLMRNATAYGVSPRLRFDLVVNNLTAWAHATGEVLMKSDGTPWRPIVHIEDIARAFLAVVEAPRDQVHMEAFNVGSTDQNYRVMDIARMVAEVVPNTRIVFAPGAGPDPLCYRVNCDKLLSRFPQTRARWTPRRAAESLYDLLRTMNLKPEDFEGARFARRANVMAQIAEGRLSGALRPERVSLEAA